MKTSNEKFLFWASFLTLIAAGMGFAITSDINTAWGRQFGFTQTELGYITGWGFAGFGLTIIFFSFFADLVGYGPLMVVAFVLHILSVALTLAAPYAFNHFGKDWAFWCLFLGQGSLSLANGTCEAVINPLTASLFPTNKTHWLNILHAGWPGGLVLGATVAWIFNQLKVESWQIRWAIILVPMLLYGTLMVGRSFPKSEARISGVSLARMAATLVAPLLLFLFLLHALVGFVELGTDRWITDITKTVLKDENTALLAFAWTNILMFTLRFFAGPIVHRISPVGLLFCSAVLGTAGLLLLGSPMINTTSLWLGAVTVYGIGKTFYWPTMLGVISERFPQGGALALGFSGGIAMISAGLIGVPCIGYMQDRAATAALKKESVATYDRYRSGDSTAPLPFLDKIAGLDNAKVGILKDNGKDLAEDLKNSPDNKDLQNYEAWWNKAKPYEKEDKPLVQDARLTGGKQALTWTAVVPVMMVLGYLFLIIYFRLRGGYKAEVLVGHKALDEKFTGGTEGPGEG
jgi:MFS family permease